MSNMSYCRFENTLTDLQDCEEALQELSSLAELNESESIYAKEFIITCARIARDYSFLVESSQKAIKPAETV